MQVRKGKAPAFQIQGRKGALDSKTFWRRWGSRGRRWEKTSRRKLTRNPAAIFYIATLRRSILVSPEKMCVRRQKDMKFSLVPVSVAVLILTLSQARAEEHLGPPLYLAAVHEVNGKSVVHWKYNIARPEFVAVELTDSEGREVVRVKRPVRQIDVTGRHGPFCLIPLDSSGKAAAKLLVPVGTVASLPWWQSLFKKSSLMTMPAVPKELSVSRVSRIGITQNEGKAQFVNLASGMVFHPVGMNYVPLRNADHAAFDAATSATEDFYDELEAETVLRLLRENGYNTVRVFLTGRRKQNPGMSGEAGTKGLYTPWLDNLADFLQRASANEIYVILNFADVDLPQNDYFREKVGNIEGTENLFREAGVLAFREMIASTVGYLKAKNPDLLKSILGVSFNNEVAAKLTQWPFTAKGPVTTANGKTYDMAVPGDRKRCYEEGLVFYYEQLCDALKSVDKDLLTCEGIFVAAAVGRDHRLGVLTFDPANLKKGFEWEREAGRVPPPLTLLVKSPIDFVDVHLYPSGSVASFAEQVEDLLGSSLYRDAVAAGLGSKKPVILGEFGAFKKDVDADTHDGLAGGMKRWSKVRDLACGKYGFVGYLGWSLETFDQKDIYQALAFGPGFLKDFREEFSWPPSKPLQAPDPSAASKSPIVLNEVPPTGPNQGFLISQRLLP